MLLAPHSVDGVESSMLINYELTEWNIAAVWPSLLPALKTDCLEIAPPHAVGSDFAALLLLLILVNKRAPAYMFCIGPHGS